MSDTGQQPTQPSPTSVKDIFLEVCDLPIEQHEQALAARCGQDTSLRAAVQELLDAQHRAGEFLAGPTFERGRVPAELGSSSATASSPSTSIPRRIGPYKLLQVIGEGGFGTVYMAEQETPVRRRVALKVIKPGMDTAQVIARFDAERQALAMMAHPGIAKVFDAGATETGRPYFVMELVSGDPITRYCDARKLDIAQRLELFEQVCSAVQHAHQKGIIHRDLKPSNILVHEQDGRSLARIIDFGIAKATRAKLTERTLFTEFRQMVGTPEYMSPEQAGGNLDVDTRSDIYSLGVLLYELLTGTTPFDGRELRSLAYAEIERVIREVDPPAPSRRLSTMRETIASVAAVRQVEPRKLNSLVHGELDWIVMRCLEKDRARRYESASALADEVRHYLADEPISAGPASAAYRTRKFVRRHKLGFAVAAVVLLALGAGLGLAIYGLQRARHERDAAIAARNSEAEAREYESQTDKFLIDVFLSIDPDESRGKPMLVQDLLDKSVDRMVRQPPTHPIVEASLRYIFGQAYFSLGQMEKSRVQLQRATEIYQKVKGPNYSGTARSLHALGQTQIELRDNSEAVESLRKALDCYVGSLGPDHADTIAGAAALADAYSIAGRTKEADTLLVEWQARAVRVLGPDARDTRIMTGALAGSRMSQGRFADAEDLYRQAMDGSRRALGEDHPDTIAIISNLGDTLRRDGKLTEAEPLQRRALELSRKVFGAEHPSTSSVEQNLALTLQGLGRLDEAETLFNHSLETRTKLFGPENARTLLTRSNIGLLWQARGKFDQAEQIFRDVADRLSKAYGPDYPDALIAENNIAWMKAQNGQYAEAEAIYIKIVPQMRRAVGDKHPNTIILLMRLGHVLNQQGKWIEAEPVLSQAYADATALGLTSAQPMFAATFGYCLAKRDKPQEALEKLLEADALLQHTLTPDLLVRSQLTKTIADIYTRLGQTREAEEWNRRLPATRPATVP